MPYKDKEKQRARNAAYYQKTRAKHDAVSREWAQNNPEKVRTTKKKYYAQNKAACAARSREWHYRSEYGVSLIQVEEMTKAQDGKCAICLTAEPGGVTGKLHLDHDHKTGKLRGLLCNNCNLGIGYLKDDACIIAKAKEYLDAHR